MYVGNEFLGIIMLDGRGAGLVDAGCCCLSFFSLWVRDGETRLLCSDRDGTHQDSEVGGRGHHHRPRTLQVYKQSYRLGSMY